MENACGARVCCMPFAYTNLETKTRAQDESDRAEHYLISSSAGADHDRRGRTRVNERAGETGRLLPRQSEVTRDGWVHRTAKNSAAAVSFRSRDESDQVGLTTGATAKESLRTDRRRSRRARPIEYEVANHMQDARIDRGLIFAGFLELGLVDLERMIARIDHE